MKKVYIAHPLRGDNYDKNIEETSKICRLIYEIFPEILPVSPIHMFDFLSHQGKDAENKVIEYCINVLKDCDEVWFFGDWRNSVGCMIENFYVGDKPFLDFSKKDCDMRLVSFVITDPRFKVFSECLLKLYKEGEEV